jgi:hypothetical protein
VLGCTAFVFFYPQRWPEILLGAGLIIALTLFVAARIRIKDLGGFGLWLKLTKLRLRPALTRKGKNKRAEDLGRVRAAIEKVQNRRRRETDQAKQSVVRQEVRKIGAAAARLKQNYADYSFVDSYFMDNGVCFRITDDHPYPHQDIYAIYADVENHRRFRRKIHYCLRKGQMLEDKEVFPAHIPATKFTSLTKAGNVLNKELRAAIGRIASRAD